MLKIVQTLTILEYNPSPMLEWGVQLNYPISSMGLRLAAAQSRANEIDTTSFG